MQHANQKMEFQTVAPPPIFPTVIPQPANEPTETPLPVIW
jgi:hypothetical protein